MKSLLLLLLLSAQRSPSAEYNGTILCMVSTDRSHIHYACPSVERADGADRNRRTVVLGGRGAGAEKRLRAGQSQVRLDRLVPLCAALAHIEGSTRAESESKNKLGGLR